MAYAVGFTPACNECWMENIECDKHKCMLVLLITPISHPSFYFYFLSAKTSYMSSDLSLQTCFKQKIFGPEDPKNSTKLNVYPFFSIRPASDHFSGVLTVR